MTMSKKLLSILTLIFLCLTISAVSAQETEEDEDVRAKFPISRYTKLFHETTKRTYYRFPTYVPLFDPLDIKYFPHETWDQENWSLLGRWENSWVYRQLIMAPEPVTTWVFNGDAPGPDYGLLDDFYLYATLFVYDNSPQDTGSCYVYYSDSLALGFGENNGILVDPISGIYRVHNTYGTSYNLTNKSHELDIIKSFKNESFPVSEENVAESSYAGPDFKYDLLDDHFLSDWRSIQKEYHIPGSEVRAYRVELIREGTNLRVYINGKLAASIDDRITTLDEEGNTVPGLVSWSYGPILYTGGETTSCGIGDLYIHEHWREQYRTPTATPVKEP